MKEKFLDELLDSEKMNILIRTRGNLSAQRLDELTNPILRFERKSSVETMIEVMKTLMNSGQCPKIWKGARTILIYKGGGRADPGNWRPITITSVLFKVIFCRIADLWGVAALITSPIGVVPAMSEGVNRRTEMGVVAT